MSIEGLNESYLKDTNRRERRLKEMGMTAYTKWWLAHPWHVTKGMPVPPDCDCEYCVEKREAEKRCRIGV